MAPNTMSPCSSFSVRLVRGFAGDLKHPATNSWPKGVFNVVIGDRRQQGGLLCEIELVYGRADGMPILFRLWSYVADDMLRGEYILNF